jgi:hypothetical protein
MPNALLTHVLITASNVSVQASAGWSRPLLGPIRDYVQSQVPHEARVPLARYDIFDRYVLVYDYVSKWASLFPNHYEYGLNLCGVRL